MAVRTFTLPDLGEGLEEAEIVEWHVAEGARVVADQPLVSVETDKAVVEVPCPWSGRVARLCAAPGDILKIGDALVEFDSDAVEDRGAIVGTLTPEDAPRPEKAEMPARETTGGAHHLAAPAARALARERGIDLATVTGTGPRGTITREDVEKAAGSVAPQAGTAARRSMARAMARAHATVVPATVTDVADITNWHAPDADILLRLVRALIAAVRAEPALNTWYDPDGTFGSQPDGMALGLAVDTPQGLYVPVVTGIEGLAPAEIRALVDEAVSDVRARRSGTAGPQTPTISLSNYGPIGGRHAALVVTPPQVAILGAGRAYETVAWKNDAPARAVELPLSLTFDHRAVTGGEAARFLSAVVADLEKPEEAGETS